MILSRESRRLEDVERATRLHCVRETRIRLSMRVELLVTCTCTLYSTPILGMENEFVGHVHIDAVRV